MDIMSNRLEGSPDCIIKVKVWSGSESKISLKFCVAVPRNVFNEIVQCGSNPGVEMFITTESYLVNLKEDDDNLINPPLGFNLHELYDVMGIASLIKEKLEE